VRAESKVVAPTVPRNKVWQTPSLFDKSGNSNQLIVTVNTASASLSEQLLRSQPAWALDTPESFERVFVEVLDTPNADPKLNETLKGAQGARFVIEQDRISDEERRHRAAADAKDAAVKLNRYIVLRYATVEGALAAIATLKSSGWFESIETDIGMRLSSTPTDQFYAIPGSPTSVNYQWGLHAMQFASAWSRTRGHGYVGVIDAPIWNWQSGNLAAYNTISNTDLTANFRQQFATLSQEVINQNFNWNVISPHGRHVSGIVAGAASTSFRSLNTALPSPNTGTAGGCPNCALILSGVAPGFFQTVDGVFLLGATHIADAIYKVSNRGAQVITMSFNGDTGITSCNTSILDTATSYATGRDVVVIGSAGNYGGAPRIPASCSSVLAVAAIELKPNTASAPASSASWQRWVTDLPAFNFQSNNASIGPPDVSVWRPGVAAPGRHIYSTFHTGDTYSLNYCGAAPGHDLSPITSDAWGICSGTSMAAPHIAALAGILKSAKPLLSTSVIVNTIKNAGHLGSNWTVELGHGVPRAGIALNALIPTNNPQNRLTPLFALYSASRRDFLYTTVPQMAIAAINGTLQPASASGGTYVTVGTIPAVYQGFPSIFSGVQPPRAEAWVFTTPENPKSASTPLVPLFRLSYACNNSNYSNASSPAACASNAQNTDTTYTTDWAGVLEFESWGYRLDGVEGYIYPKTLSPQPLGTVRLMRKYNEARDDHAIFPEALLTQMTNLGYTVNSGSDWLGYVYASPSTGVTPTIQ
jgi:serine protease